jgi:glycosyltransferase involved in cell wall biosynthesis
MTIQITSLQALPSVRDYRISVAVMNRDPSVCYTVLVDTPEYNRIYEDMGHNFGPIHYWRRKPRNLLGRVWYHLTGEPSAGQELARKVETLGTDIVLTQNLDYLGYYAIRYTDLPVVHDVSDFYSIFPRKQDRSRWPSFSLWREYAHWRRLQYEKFVFERADALIFNSSHMLEIAHELYNIRGETLVVPNAVPAADVPQRLLTRLSALDGECHTVFVGHINQPKLDRLRQVADQGLHVHLYTYQANSFIASLLRACADHPYLHHHGSLSYRELLIQLTQYDYGLILWYQGARERFFDASLPSKLFDYLASGVPVIVGPYKALVDFVSSHNCGFVVQDVSEIREKLADSYTVGDRNQYIMEYYVPDLIALYHQLA